MLKQTFAVLIGAGLAAGCQPSGQTAFLEVQVCLEDREGISEFKSIMRQTAAETGLAYIDGSERSEESSKIRGVYEFPIIHVAINGKSGLGVTAANMGLSEFEAALGFTEGKSPEVARDLANRLTRKLEERWELRTVPAEQGAVPLEHCSPDSE